LRAPAKPDGPAPITAYLFSVLIRCFRPPCLLDADRPCCLRVADSPKLTTRCRIMTLWVLILLIKVSTSMKST
jgi:hypothetical protein